MALKATEQRDRIFEKLSYKVPIHVMTGEVLEFNEDNKVIEVDDDGSEHVLPEQAYIIAEFNEKVYNRIVKTARQIVRSRGLLAPDEVTPGHKYITKLRRKMFPGSRRITDEQMEALVYEVRTQMQPFYILVLMQCTYFGMINSDIFRLDNTGRKAKIEDKFDTIIPDDYWEGTNRKEITDDGTNAEEDEEDAMGAFLDNILENIEIIEPNLDKTNPLEQFIAIVTTFLNDYENAREGMEPYFMTAFRGLSLLMENERYDDFRVLDARLDDILYTALPE